MKHCLILSMCAVALAAFGINAANAGVDVALNLNYVDPADPNDGGSWTLVAKSDNANGIAGLVVRIEDGTIPAAGTVDAGIGHSINSGVLQIGTFTDPNGPDFVEFVYGQDPNAGLVGNVGLAAAASNQGPDPLGNSVWDDATVIATGSFLDVRPLAVLAAATEIDPNGAIIGSSINTFNIRGDSLNTLGLEDPNGAGLLAGDTDRDNDVDIADLGTLAGSLAGGVGGWNDGDTDGDGDVDIADLGALAASLAVGSGTPAAVGAVPEPTTALLALFGVAPWALRRRRA